jgi:hypothetical protein
MVAARGTCRHCQTTRDCTRLLPPSRDVNGVWCRGTCQETISSGAFRCCRRSAPPRKAVETVRRSRNPSRRLSGQDFFVRVMTLVGLVANAIVDYVGPEWAEKEIWRMSLNPIITKLILSISHLF